METLMSILPAILYILGIVLLIVLIVLGIKLIETIDRANSIISDIEKKTKSLSGLFNIIDKTTDTLSYIGDSIVENIVSFLSRVFKRKKNKIEEE